MRCPPPTPWSGGQDLRSGPLCSSSTSLAVTLGRKSPAAPRAAEPSVGVPAPPTRSSSGSVPRAGGGSRLAGGPRGANRGAAVASHTWERAHTVRAGVCVRCPLPGHPLSQLGLRLPLRGVNNSAGRARPAGVQLGPQHPPAEQDGCSSPSVPEQSGGPARAGGPSGSVWGRVPGWSGAGGPHGDTHVPTRSGSPGTIPALQLCRHPQCRACARPGPASPPRGRSLRTGRASDAPGVQDQPRSGGVRRAVPSRAEQPGAVPLFRPRCQHRAAFQRGPCPPGATGSGGDEFVGSQPAVGALL